MTKNHLLLIFIAITSVLSGCDKNEPEPPEPDFTHEITIDGNVEGANYKVWKNGNATTRIANQEGDTDFLYTDENPSMSLDSITGTKEGFTKWKVGAQTINTKKNYVATLEELSNPQEFWIEGNINSQLQVPMTAKAYKDGEEILTWNGNSGNYKTNVKITDIGKAETLTIDSLVFEGFMHQKHKETNVELEPNGTTKNVDLSFAGSMLTGNITNIDGDGKLSDAYVVAWDGNGNITYAQTDAEGKFELPANKDYNEIKIIKEGFQTRTIYEKTENDMTIDKNVFDKETFPLDAIVEMTKGVIKHFVDTPTVYIYKELDQFPQTSYDMVEAKIRDLDEFNQGNTSYLEIKQITDRGELPPNDDDNPVIFIKFVSGENSGYGLIETTNKKNIRNGIIDIHHLNPEYAIHDLEEEFGSVYSGARTAPRETLIKSRYHDMPGWQTGIYQKVDSLLSKFHWSRKNETVVATDTEVAPTNFNKLDNSGEINDAYFFQNSTLIKQEFINLPEPVKNEIEN